MEFSYRISPFIFTKYMFYTFRWLLLLLPAALCPTLPPMESMSPALSLLACYVVLALSLCVVTFMVSTPFSLFFTLWQRQAGVVSRVRLDDTGLTEHWRDRQVHIPWASVRRTTLRRRFLQLKARSPRAHWFLFRGSVDRETFLALSCFIRSHVSP